MPKRIGRTTILKLLSIRPDMQWHPAHLLRVNAYFQGMQMQRREDCSMEEREEREGIRKEPNVKGAQQPIALCMRAALHPLPWFHREAGLAGNAAALTNDLLRIMQWHAMASGALTSCACVVPGHPDAETPPVATRPYILKPWTTAR